MASAVGGAPARGGKKKKAQIPSLLHPLVYGAVRGVTTLPQMVGVSTSIAGAAALGRLYGSARFNRRRVEAASERVRFALRDIDEAGARDLVLASFSHLFQLGVEIACMPRLLSGDAWLRHVELGNLDGALEALIEGRPSLMLTGHCGNWEMMGYTMAVLGFPIHALYRPLDMKPVDRWLRRTRARRGLILVDKFGAATMLPRLMAQGVPVGFVADQNAGDRGIFVPFFGRLTSSYKAIGLMAMQHKANVVCASARRLRDGESHIGDVGGGHDDGGLRYRVELTDVIRPADWEGHPDPLFYITARYRRAIEQMVRIAPEQYLWMHRIWKSRPAHEKFNSPMPARLREKLQTLPWLSEAEVETICDQSDRDRAYLAEHGLERLP